MNKPLLFGLSGLTLIALTATTLYAQSTTASTIIAKMKAAAANFTLTELIPSGQTGLTSAPLVAKKTGDILTAGEYNRLLEIVSEGGGGAGLELWKCTCGGYMNMVTTSNLIYGETCIFGNGGTANNVQYSSWSCTKLPNTGGANSAGGGAQIVEGGIIKTSPKTISNWDLITLEGSWNSGGGDAAPTGGYIYKLGGQAKLAYVEASGISKDVTLTTTAQSVHNLTVKLSGDSVVIDPSSSNTLAYLVWKLGGSGGGSSSPWTSSCPTDMSLVGTAGTRNAFCIETNVRTGTIYHNAAANCRTAGKSLCTYQQWTTACLDQNSTNRKPEPALIGVHASMEWILGAQTWSSGAYQGGMVIGHHLNSGTPSCLNSNALDDDVEPLAATVKYRCCSY